MKYMAWRSVVRGGIAGPWGLVWWTGGGRFGDVILSVILLLFCQFLPVFRFPRFRVFMLMCGREYLFAGFSAGLVGS